MTTLPLITIGIPTYNRALSLKRAVDSALAQDYPNLEILISDNASTDATQELCFEYAGSNPAIRYIRQEKNVGPTKNFLSVLSHARGEFFMWLADDDWLGPRFISQCAGPLIENDQLVQVGGIAHFYEDSKVVRESERIDLLEDNSFIRVLKYYRVVTSNSILFGLMRRNIALSTHAENTLGGDFLFTAAMAYQGKIKTNANAVLHRSLGGASASIKHLTRSLALNDWHAVTPNLSIVLSSFIDIASRNAIYREQSTSKRFVLAVAVFVLLLIKLVVVGNTKTIVVRSLVGFMGEERYRTLRDCIRR